MLVHLLILGHVFSEQARTSSKLEIPTVDALATETMLRISDFWDYISIRDPNLYALTWRKPITKPIFTTIRSLINDTCHDFS
jgi:hypothetical protein